MIALNISIKKVVLFSLFCIQGLVLASGWQLQHDAVIERVHTIEKRMQRDKYVLMTLMGIGAGIQLYAMMQPCPVTEQESVVVSLLESLQSGFKNLGTRTKHLLFTQEGWWKIIKFFGRLSGDIGTWMIMQAVMEKIWHPDTLHWYVHAYVPYGTTIQTMKIAVKKLQDPLLSQEQHAYFGNLLSVACNKIVQHGEHIAAYMLYKSKELSAHERIIAQNASVYIFNYHNDWLYDCVAYIDSAPSDYAKMLEHVQAYEDEIASQLKIFASIEGETQQERSAVGGK